MAQMTPECLRDACKKNGGYAQPTLNDQLFLQCRGFSKIENLEPYTNLKVLWLEQNGISAIEGLDTCTKLVSLFLQNNAINRLSGLSSLGNLRILNLSNNYISQIDGLAASCPLLETLQLSHNQIASLRQCEDLWRLRDTLSSVDLSFNKIDREEGDTDLVVVNFFSNLPNASVIYMHGNSLTHGLKCYRKNMIVHLPQLTYLDERPVFPDERRTTEAWGRGGEKAEADERALIKSEKREELTSCVTTMARALEAGKETRDRLSKQWEERREEEREQLRLRRLESKKQVQALDSKEYDARGGVEVEESDAWFELESELLTVLDKAQKSKRANRRAFEQVQEVEALRRQVDEDLREQESRIAGVLAKMSENVPPAQPVDSSATAAPAAEVALAQTKSRETMEYWIRQLDHSDEEVLAQMEQDLQGFLSELEPGLRGAPRLAAEETKSSKKITGVESKLSRSVTHAVAVTAASLRDGKPKSEYSREALWDSYYTWETRNKK